MTEAEGPVEPWGAPPADTQAQRSTAERASYVIFAIFLAVSLFIVGSMARTTTGPDFEVGTCVNHEVAGRSESWTRIDCAQPHDFVVVAIEDSESACPGPRAGVIWWNTGGLVPRDRVMCLQAAAQ
jgi:hypothetical protein